MRRSVILLVGLVALIGSTAQAGEDKPWFDMENCAYCKHITAEKGLMENMCIEYHDLSHGLLSVTVVDKEYKEHFDRAQKAMAKTGEEMLQSQTLPYMCGHCEAYGAFMMAGVQPDYVETEAGHILVWTSDKPEMVERLHAFGKRSMDEYNKMHAEESK